MEEIVQVTCQSCGKKAEGDVIDLYNLGWDLPPFISYVTTCPDCPSAPLILEMLKSN